MSYCSIKAWDGALQYTDQLFQFFKFIVTLCRCIYDGFKSKDIDEGNRSVLEINVLHWLPLNA